jgi:hypothetical protein
LNRAKFGDTSFAKSDSSQLLEIGNVTSLLTQLLAETRSPNREIDIRFDASEPAPWV